MKIFLPIFITIITTLLLIVPINKELGWQLNTLNTILIIAGSLYVTIPLSNIIHILINRKKNTLIYYLKFTNYIAICVSMPIIGLMFITYTHYNIPFPIHYKIIAGISITYMLTKCLINALEKLYNLRKPLDFL